jgi:hypothetical protein
MHRPEIKSQFNYYRIIQDFKAYGNLQIDYGVKNDISPHNEDDSINAAVMFEFQTPDQIQDHPRDDEEKPKLPLKQPP